MSSYTIVREAVVTEAEIIKAGEQLVADGKKITGNVLRRVLGERGTPRLLMEVWLRHFQGDRAQDEAPSPAHADALEGLRGTLREQAISAADSMLTSAWQAAVRISEERGQAELSQLRADLSERDQTIRELEEALQRADAAKADMARQWVATNADLTEVRGKFEKAEQAASYANQRIQDLDTSEERLIKERDAALKSASEATTAAQIIAEERDRLIQERDEVHERARQADDQRLTEISELRDAWTEAGRQVATLEGMQKGLQEVIDRLRRDSREQIEDLNRELVEERQARENLQRDLAQALAGKAAAEATVEAVAGGAREEAERVRRDLATVRTERDALVERAVTAEAEVRRLEVRGIVGAVRPA